MRIHSAISAAIATTVLFSIQLALIPLAKAEVNSKISQASGTHYNYKVVHSFKGSDGANPYATFVQGADGFLYGTTNSGGKYNFGTLYKMSNAGEVTVVHDFNDDGVDGTSPFEGLTLANDGNLYGTTAGGGSGKMGTIYRLTAGGEYSIVHAFDPFALEGSNPYSPPIQASDGNLYGTLPGGGSVGAGTVYRMTLAGEFTALTSFAADGSEGSGPWARLTQGSDGLLYGTTTTGGASNNGTVFRMTTSGAIEVIHSFNAATGSEPFSPLIQTSDGNFYGTTERGGIEDLGTIYKITSSGKFTLLHEFTSTGLEGNTPGRGALLPGPDGNLYGVTYFGGTYNHGVLYKASTKGKVSVIHPFGGGAKDGEHPDGGLLGLSDGSIYGTSVYGAGSKTINGTVFRLSP